MTEEDYPIKCVTGLMGRFGDELGHVMMGQRAADMFSVVRIRVVVMNVNVTEDEKVSR